MYCLDTSIVIDFFRQRTAVQPYFEHPDEILLSHIVAGELLQGARNAKEIQQTAAFLDLFYLHLGSGSIGLKALEWLSQYGPSHGVGYFDCYLAATAVETESILVTLNAKHFLFFPGLTVKVP